VFTRPAKTLRPPLAVPPRPGPAPRSSSHLPRPWVTRHQRGFTHVRPSGLPLACLPGWNGSASASSLSSAPRSYPQRTSGRGLTLNTGQELRHRHHAGPPIHKLTRNMPPRVAHLQPSHRRRTAHQTPLDRHLQSMSRQREENTNGLMEQCSRQQAGTTPLQWYCSPHGQRGHCLCQGLDTGGVPLKPWRLPHSGFV
jgi:hypothetical protein